MPRARKTNATASAAGSSRAAAFALRTALIAGSAGAAACSSTHDRGVESGPSPSDGFDGGAVDNGDRAAPQPGSMTGGGIARPTQITGRAGSSGGRAAPDEEQFDAGADEDAGFAPIAIYGGAFPDPKSRAKV